MHGGVDGRVWTVQTVVRRLSQSQTHDPALNPFIEKDASGATTGHSVASTTASSVSPKPVVQAEDVVIAGPGSGSGSDEPLRRDFVAALQRALGLSEADMEQLRSTDPSAASPLVSNTLCAVRECVLREGRCGCGMRDVMPVICAAVNGLHLCWCVRRWGSLCMLGLLQRWL